MNRSTFTTTKGKDLHLLSFEKKYIKIKHLKRSLKAVGVYLNFCKRFIAF